MKKYETIKDKIIFKVVDIEASRDELKDCMYTELNSGLALIYYICNEVIEGYNNTLITNDFINYSGYDKEQIRIDAMNNMETKHPAILVTIGDAMRVACGCHVDNLLDYESEIEGDESYTLSNKELLYGASSMVYKGVLEKIGNKLKSSYYIIPSSVHELMIVSTKHAPKVNKILETLKEGNESYVCKHEYLSDRLFMYDRNTCMIAEVATLNHGRKL